MVLTSPLLQFDSVKAFWGLYNHLNLDKMPVGSNLRVFKSHIQPIWEDEMNKEGGNWIVVPRPREVAGVLVFKELLLSIIGGDLDRYVNGIVLSIKPSDIITQIWLPTNKTSRKSKVQAIAMTALQQHCKQLLGSDPSGKSRIDWTWRVHPTATLLPAEMREGTRAQRGSLGEGVGGRRDAKRGACGECVELPKKCAVM